jgi:hypothetical protein
MTPSQGMENWLPTLQNALWDWTVQLSTNGSGIYLSTDSPGVEWSIYFDPDLPGTTAGETNLVNHTVRINPNIPAERMYALLLHEIGHVVWMHDVYSSFCAGETVMFFNDDGNPGYITTADNCTMWHVYSIRDESPIILTLEPGYPRMTGPEVLFDLSNCGAPQLLGWTQPGVPEGFLVLDRNGDAKITSGAEMFGNYTPLPSTPEYFAMDGFQALAAFDDPVNGGNRDGWITIRDQVFSALRLWIDENHDGVSDAAELKTLSELGIEAISVVARESRRRDRFGNEMRLAAPFVVRRASGEPKRLLAVDVFLSR